MSPTYAENIWMDLSETQIHFIFFYCPFSLVFWCSLNRYFKESQVPRTVKEDSPRKQGSKCYDNDRVFEKHDHTALSCTHRSKGEGISQKEILKANDIQNRNKIYINCTVSSDRLSSAARLLTKRVGVNLNWHNTLKTWKVVGSYTISKGDHPLCCIS